MISTVIKKQKYRPMLYNRKSRDKPMHLWSPKIWQRRQEYKRRKTASSRSRARKSGQLMLKKKKIRTLPNITVVVAQSPSYVQLFVTPRTPAYLQHVLYHLLKFTQVHAHCISDAKQTSDPLTPSSPSAFNPSQHQGLFQWVGCLHQMTKILEFQLQHQSFQWGFRVNFP